MNDLDRAATTLHSMFPEALVQQSPNCGPLADGPAVWFGLHGKSACIDQTEFEEGFDSPDWVPAFFIWSGAGGDPWAYATTWEQACARAIEAVLHRA